LWPFVRFIPTLLARVLENEMASFEKRVSDDGASSYRVKIRLRGHEPVSATFQRLTDAKAWAGQIVTTRWILAEVADALSAPHNRSLASAFIEQVESSSQFRLLEQSDALFRHGLSLFNRRCDKDWSLTDCISFVVMERHGIREALTGDHHFEQAGFVALLN
jgi:predicted nucleic acid-binding protein